MGNVVEMILDRIELPLPAQTSFDWQKYRQAKDAYMALHPTDKGFKEAQRRYELEAINMAHWMDVIMQMARG